LRVAVVVELHRVDVGKLRGTTPALLYEVNRLARQLRELVADNGNCVTKEVAARIRATLDEVDATKNRMEPTA
jgi:hypothetical protein